MYLSSAYPNSDLSALSMTVIAVVMAISLGAWLVLVFLADRQPRAQRATEIKTSQAEEGLPAGRSGIAKRSDIAA